MYKINQVDKTSEKLQKRKFSELDIKERYDIQEWIANNPAILEYSQELLVIQKEFCGFENTGNRLDLLALDKGGNLVIIENKRDDTGKDVVWQALTYASFCSTLTSSEIVEIYQDYLSKNNRGEEDAESLIREFLGEDTVSYPTNKEKIILVAGEFRKEVLSAAQWLNTNGIDITCIKMTPYDFKGELLIEVDRILPQEELKDHSIRLARKVADTKLQEEKKDTEKKRNQKFWSFFSTKFNKAGTVFENVNSWTTCTSSFIGAVANIGHSLSFNFVITDKSSRVELYIDSVNAVYNKQVFDVLYSRKGAIEKSLSEYAVTWQRLDEKRASRISIYNYEFAPKEEENRDRIAAFLIDAMEKLISAIQDQKTEVEKIPFPTIKN